MEYRTYVPAPPLSTFIERFWACSDEPVHSRERIVPSGTVELVINLREDEIRIFDTAEGNEITRYSGAVVSGPYEQYFVIDPLLHGSMIGVHFRPGGAAPFLHLPLGELTSRHLSLESLWGAEAARIRDRLCAANTFETRFAILENVLRQRFRLAATHPAVASALYAFNGPSSTDVLVHDVVRDVGISHRRFSQLFARAIGLTPKLYLRIQRFQRARMMARSHSAPAWTTIAATCGYFDQAHLHRDFLAFSGFSPGSYRRHDIDGGLPNHVASIS